MLSGFSESPSLDARALLAYVIQSDPLLSWRELTPDEEEKMLECIEKRKKGMPIAYITGEKEFMGLSFYVNENTLIPRPDTETIVETLIEENPFEKPHITDLCSGSGCIGISLAHYIKNSTVTMWDISPGAIEIAQKNILRHNLSGRVCALKGDVLKDTYPKSDIIVSNPPYIADKIADTLEVSRFEPSLALKGGEDGLNFYRTMIPKAFDSLHDGGILAFEIGYDQGEAVKKLMEEYFDNVKIKKDYADNDRMVYGYKNVEL
ncbi:MAG: peptide chain release factor N(5)-glutamine methyltransferase [Clostridia bacterium]|nr:peptide chain release factor N(5)-glutamine methyltransferase [Clostridia bacterium]